MSTDFGKIVREYAPELFGKLSGDDKMAVVLPVRDWQSIVDFLREEAEASSLGPAQSALVQEHDTEVTSITEIPELADKYQAAYDHDYRVTPPFSCAAGTDRVIDTICEILRRNGWRE